MRGRVVSRASGMGQTRLAVAQRGKETDVDAARQRRKARQFSALAALRSRKSRR